MTGAAGFLGRTLIAELIRRETLCGKQIHEIIGADLVAVSGADLVAPSAGSARPAAAEPRVRTIVGPVAERLEELFAEPVDVVVHLASAVSAACEADVDLGMRANVDTTRAVLDRARAQAAAGGPLVTLTFSSSVAVYGSDPAHPLPAVIDETTLPLPQSSYGAQKLVCEQLIADYTRKGFVDGRVVRLMTVAIRAGAPNAAASGFVSGIVREPLAGLPTTLPVDPSVTLAIASPQRTVEGILRVTEATRGTGPGQLTGRLPVNLPALTCTVADLLDALREVGGESARALVRSEPDPAIEAIVASWPARFDNTRAARLGLLPDPSVAAIVRRYAEEHPEAVGPGAPPADRHR